MGSDPNDPIIAHKNEVLMGTFFEISPKFYK